MSKKRRSTRVIRKAIKKNPAAVGVVLILIIAIIGVAVALWFINPSIYDPILNLLGIERDGDENGDNEDIDPLNKSDGELVVTYVDVGQGDCIIIQFPDNKNMIIDGGDTGYATEVKAAIDKLSITKFDYVLLTHTDADHCGSLDDALNYEKIIEVENVYLPKIKSKDYDLGLSSDYLQKTTVVYNNFVKAAKDSTYKDSSNVEKPANLIFTEDIITFSDTNNTYKFTMYCRDDDYYKSMKDEAHPLNDVSPICVLEFNGKKLMFTGDANNSEVRTSSEKSWLDIMNSKGIKDEDFDVDVLKVAHHGGEDSSGSDFLDFVDPKYAIVCVGGNQDESKQEYNLFINKELASNGDYIINPNAKYGHPTGAVCAENGRLSSAGTEAVYYTMFNGTISCKIDKDGNITFNSDKTASLNGSEILFS